MGSPQFDITGDIGTDDVSASALANFLTHNQGYVTVLINSPGGDAMEGAAMMAEIERHGRVTAFVQGIAASAATLPMVAAREVVIHPTAMVMVHEPSAWGGGTADKLRDIAQALDKMGLTYAHAYARHTGHTVARIAAWMKAETWLTAQEAVELRFADRIEGTGATMTAAAFDYSKFRDPPEALVRLTKENGWASDGLKPKQKGRNNAV